MKSTLHHYTTTLSNIWNDQYHVRGIEKFCALVLYALKVLTPGFWFRTVIERKFGYKNRNTIMDLYLFIKLTLIFILLSSNNTISVNIALFLGIYMTFDVVQYFLGLVFLGDIYSKTPSIKNSFAHLLANIVEIIGGFAVLYLYSGTILVNHTHPLQNGIEAFYFSLITFATIGYGDMMPSTNVGQILVILQSMVSFIFIAIIVSSFVATRNGNSIIEKKK